MNSTEQIPILRTTSSEDIEGHVGEGPFSKYSHSYNESEGDVEEELHDVDLPSVSGYDGRNDEEDSEDDEDSSVPDIDEVSSSHFSSIENSQPSSPIPIPASQTNGMKILCLICQEACDSMDSLNFHYEKMHPRLPSKDIPPPAPPIPILKPITLRKTKNNFFEVVKKRPIKRKKLTRPYVWWPNLSSVIRKELPKCRMICPRCGISYSNFKNLRNHIDYKGSRHVHINELREFNPFALLEKPKDLKRFRKLRLTFEQDEFILPFTTEPCDDVRCSSRSLTTSLNGNMLETRDEVKENEYVVMESNEECLPHEDCPICKATFDCEETFRTHVAESHPEDFEWIIDELEMEMERRRDNQ